MRAFFARLRDAFRRRSIARAFNEEMSFHVSELEREYRERGQSPEEARAAAARKFGNAVQAREALRDRAGFPAWDVAWNDWRFAARGLRRRPALSCAVVAILTLGLGAAAVIHSLVDAVFLRPLPVSHPEELQAVVNGDDGPNRQSRGTVRRLEAALPPASVAAYSGGSRGTLRIGAQPATRASLRLVNGDFFAMLGLVPSAGRLLTPRDDTLGDPTSVVVLSEPWARANFGTPEAALGKEIVVNRLPVTIVGVLPASFHDIIIGQRTDFWFPTALQERLHFFGNSSTTSGDDRPNDPDWNREERVSWLQILLRAKPGGPAAALALQRAWEPQRDSELLTFADPKERERLLHKHWQIVAAPGGQSLFRDSFHSTGWLLGGVVAVMLVLVCTNVSGLLLVRSMSRHREIGVRLALGAGSWRVLQLGLFEAVQLSLLGALGGTTLALWLLPAAVRLLAPGQDIGAVIGVHSILMMAALALGTAVASVLAPALWISRVEPLNALAGTRGLGQAPVRLGRFLVMAQFAIAVALVAVAIAFGQELQRSLQTDPGFEREHVLTATFDPNGAGYGEGKVLPLVDRLQTAALGVPGVRRVSFAANGILAGSRSTSGLRFRDARVAVADRHFQHDTVMPGFFGTTGTPLIVGREFQLADTPSSPRVAVVTASFARKAFGDLNPIGQVFGYDDTASKDDWTVVGVVADMRTNGVRADEPPMFYTCAPQGDNEGLYFLAVRFEGAGAPVMAQLRATFGRLEPGLVFSGWKTLQTRMTDDLSGDLAVSRLTGIFGACAIVLAAVGVAGSLGYLVVLRQRELALRMAIGADPNRVLRSVLLDALRLCAGGGVAGLLIVWLVPQFPALKTILYRRPGLDSALLAAAVALVAAAVAGWFPARRASRIDPMLTLKSE